MRGSGRRAERGGDAAEVHACSSAASALIEAIASSVWQKVSVPIIDSADTVYVASRA